MKKILFALIVLVLFAMGCALLLLAIYGSLVFPAERTVGTAPTNVLNCFDCPAMESAGLPTIGATPTAINASSFFSDAQRLLKAYQPPDTDPAPLYNSLAQGASNLLRAAAIPNTPLRGQKALDLLMDGLIKLGLPQDVTPSIAVIPLSNDQDLVFICLNKLMALPVIGLRRQGSVYQTLPMQMFAVGGDLSNRDFVAGGIAPSQDLTGDGIPELIYTYEFRGAGALAVQLTVQRWLTDTFELETIFRAGLVNWAGESKSEIVSADGKPKIKITFPWFGAFDHKLLAHPTATQMWMYVPGKNTFLLQSAAVENATTVRQQVNVGEDWLARGEYARALAAYERAMNDKMLKDEDFGNDKPNFRAFARLRYGQMLALLNREQDARDALSQAQQAGGTIAQLTAAFVKNYSGADGAIRAWAMLPSAIDLDKLLYDGKAGNLGFPFDANNIFAKGQVVAAYLNAHPDALAQSDQLFAKLGALGFKPVSNTKVDFDGDGVSEILFITQDGGASSNKRQSLWMAYRMDKRWGVRVIDNHETLVLRGVKSLPNKKGNTVLLQLPQNTTPRTIALTWDRARVIVLDADTLQPRDPRVPLWNFGEPGQPPSF